jgi:hypothetical protein
LLDKYINLIYGAVGKQKVVDTLKVLSDDFILINDFNISFSQALFYKQEADYIKSLQVDHFLIGPTGIFIIETKNWSG